MIHLDEVGKDRGACRVPRLWLQDGLAGPTQELYDTALRLPRKLLYGEDAYLVGRGAGRPAAGPAGRRAVLRYQPVRF
ncbi:hypothetical protein [Streptomyces sp. E5N298]|uniref:hypothetical protein n=1 Tax=Streptomyces sp. E5N298 TaxID=1851983 RepID=UPI00187D6998|nr:hypothetical protein [Streptomyces sp. E5N298]